MNEYQRSVPLHETEHVEPNPLIAVGLHNHCDQQPKQIAEPLEH